MAQFKKRVAEIRRYLHEPDNENDPKSFRFHDEEEDIVRMKLKYLLKHRKELLNDNKDREVALCLGYLAIAYIKLNDMENAKEVLDSQLKYAKEHKNEFMQRMAYGNLGVVSKLQFKIGTAMHYYELSLEIALRHNNLFAQNRLYNNMGNIYELVFQYGKAIEMHKKHLQVAYKLKNRDAIVKACGSLVSLYHVIGDYQTTIDYIEELMHQLRINLRALDVLADDESDDDDEGYINLEEPEDDGEGDKEGDKGEGEEGGAEPSTGFFAKIKKKLTGG